MASLRDNGWTRMKYFQSSYLTGFVPYIGAPLYIVWLAWFYIGSLDGTPFEEVMARGTAWVVYMILIRFYTVNILTSLNNYAMLIVTEEQLQSINSDQIFNPEESETGPLGSFEADGDQDAILDEWIFGN